MTAQLPIVGVGASAGGLEALRQMLSEVTPDVGMSFVIVQHLDPNHESMLAELMTRACKLPVRQIAGGERVDPGQIYIIPPGFRLGIANGVLELEEFEQPRGLRRPIDDFLESLALDRHECAACVILSGTGADGTIGLRAIKEHGGLCVVQEPDTARYDGMPVSAVGTGLVDFVKPPEEIVDTLQRFFDRRQESDSREKAAEVVSTHIDEMCDTLKKAIGHDFAGYKRSTLVRRIERRMQVLEIQKPDEYLARIRSDEDECEALFRDLLINVTRFFRDPEFFETLREKVIEPLVEKATPSRELRVWVPGCSSGEEAYSIAILFAEAMRGRQFRPIVQIFATDIDERMLDIARAGSYPNAALADIPSNLREHYTVGHDGRFEISPKVRDMIRFSSHSLVKDPPFSKVDLVSCRNLLIYFGDRLQKQVFPILHYAIRPGGYLLLGPSESIGRHEDMFEPVDQKARLFQRTDGRSVYPIDLPASIDAPAPNRARPARVPRERQPDWDEDLPVRRIIERYAPASMTVDEAGEILSSSGRLSKYFEFPNPGARRIYAPTIARQGLREKLSSLMRQAVETRQRVISRDVSVQAEFGSQKVDVIADPLPDGTLLLVFRDAAPFEPGNDEDLIDLGPSDSTVQQLEDELRLTRYRLRSAVEELETANEELKSSNEEMMSMNEELQSTNEELSTVNDELKSKVDELTVANSDMRNFLGSTQLAVIVVDGDLRVRSYTDAATEIYPLKPSDRGRALTEVSSRIDDDHIMDEVRSAMTGSDVSARTVTSRDGSQHWSLRVLPYRLKDGTVEGATLVFTDISDALAMQSELESERRRLELAVRVARIGVWEYHIKTGVTVLDATELELMGLEGEQTHDIERLLERVHPDDRSRVEASLRRAIAGESDYEASFRICLSDGKTRHLRGLGRLVEDGNERGKKRLIGVTYDVSPEAQLAEQREFLLREMNHRVKNLFAVISSLVSGAARTSDTPRQLADEVSHRIRALGRAHSLSQQPGDQEVDLEGLVRGSLEAHLNSGAIAIEGPSVAVPIEAITPLALILHEWTTNSVKYGALGQDDGHLLISWNRVTGNGVRIAWTETGTSAAPEGDGSGGFGTRLVSYSAQQLGAKIEYPETGQGWTATIDLDLEPVGVQPN